MKSHKLSNKNNENYKNTKKSNKKYKNKTNKNTKKYKNKTNKNKTNKNKTNKNYKNINKNEITLKQNNSFENVSTKELVNSLKKAISPSNITPQNDYYSYINYKWLKTYRLKEEHKYITQIDDFRIIQDKVYRELIQISVDYITNPTTKNTKLATCIRNARNARIRDNTIEQQSSVAKTIFELIDTMSKNKNNFWKMLAFFNKNEVISWCAPFVWSIQPDYKNPNVYACYLEPPQLTLIDINVYLEGEKNADYQNTYKNGYLRYLHNLFQNAFGKYNQFNIHDIFICECKLAKAMYCDVLKEDEDKIYNSITGIEAIKKYKFNWEAFTKELGFKIVPPYFITTNINYLMCCSKLMLEEWNLPEWKTYWMYVYIKQQQRWAKKGSELSYDFNGKFFRGQQKILDPGIKTIFTIGYLFNTFLTNEYVKTHKNMKTINYVETMANDLKAVFIRIIKRNKWLERKTKNKAIEKLNTLKFIIGSPEKLEKDPLLDYKKDDPWGNLQKMSLWRLNNFIHLVGKPVLNNSHSLEWSLTPLKFIGTEAYLVNAYYTPFENSIRVPLGYIQKPFVDLDERGIEYNLSRIGFTIAHELSHALDDFGSQYDENGAFTNWWTKNDKKHFERIQENVVKQYETFAAEDGIKFDAWPTIGENIADINGINICLEYLKDFQLKNEYILPVQQKSFEMFFIYYAMQYRQIVKKKAIRAQLKTNPHPLDKYRCNVPLSRHPIFRTIYNIKKGDKMWWDSTNRIFED